MVGTATDSDRDRMHLFDKIDQGFCIIEVLFDAERKSIDYRFLETNAAFERQTGLIDAVGKRMRSLAPDHEQYWFDIYGEIALTGEPQRFEQRADALGHWYEVYAFRIDDPEQRLVGILFNDIAERKKVENALRESEARQAFMLELSDALRAQSDTAAMIQAAASLLGERLKASRIMFAELDEDRGVADIFFGWFADGAAPFPTVMSLEEYKGSIVDDLLSGRTVRIDDVGPPFAKPDLAAIAQLGVKALLSVPIVAGGRMVVNLSVHQSTARQWTDDDVALAREVMERLWADLVRMRAEAALRDSEARFRQFSDASTNVLWIRDAETLEMLFASPAFEAIYGIPGPDRGGSGSVRTWARLIEPESRKAVLANLRRVRAGERIEQEFRIRRAPDGVPRWVSNTDFPLRDAAGEVRWLAGLGADITDAKEAADRRNVLVAELQHRTRNLIAVVGSLSDRTLGNATSLEDFGNRFRLRLSALSRVQGLLSHLAAGERVEFDELLRSELTAHGAIDSAGKVTLNGPAGVPLRSSTVQTLALALHELATNAVKYGALAAPDGHLLVRWHVEPGSGDDLPHLHVEWQESGVVMPQLSAPSGGGGYGRELIERALPYQLSAKTSYALGADGVRCTIVVPISRATKGGV